MYVLIVRHGNKSNCIWDMEWSVPYGIQPHSIWTKDPLWIPWTGTWTPWTGSTWTPWTGPHGIYGLIQNRTENLLIILVSKCRIIDKILYFVQWTGSCHVTCSHVNQCVMAIKHHYYIHHSPSPNIPSCPPPLQLLPQVKTQNDTPRTATRCQHNT